MRAARCTCCFRVPGSELRQNRTNSEVSVSIAASAQQPLASRAMVSSRCGLYQISSPFVRASSCLDGARDGARPSLREVRGLLRRDHLEPCYRFMHGGCEGRIAVEIVMSRISDDAGHNEIRDRTSQRFTPPCRHDRVAACRNQGGRCLLALHEVDNRHMVAQE